MIVFTSRKGSMRALEGSGRRSMSDASMPRHPAKDEPSKGCPSSNVSSSMREAGTVRCISLPAMSVKRSSTYLTSLSLSICSASAAVVMMCSPKDGLTRSRHRDGSYPISSKRRAKNAVRTASSQGRVRRQAKRSPLRKRGRGKVLSLCPVSVRSLHQAHRLFAE